jgi:hypothetical protein
MAALLLMVFLTQACLLLGLAHHQVDLLKLCGIPAPPAKEHHLQPTRSHTIHFAAPWTLWDMRTSVVLQNKWIGDLVGNGRY